MAPIFSDNFESGTMAAWTTTGTNPLEANTNRNIVPAGGLWSAYLNTSIDRMHHNIIADNGGTELDGHILFTSWIYDEGTNSGTVGATRIFNEIRGYSGGSGLPNGGTVASGTLAQLLAVGKFNSTTLPGDVFTTAKYQGRVAFGPGTAGTTGWMNLNGPGSPNRSVGWHRFDIEVMPGGTAVRFYVDGILSRTFNGATVATYDTVILGPGLGTQIGNAWIDGVAVGRVDEPPVITCPPNITVPATSAAGAVVNYTVTAADDFDPNVTIVCNPPSGSTFPIGTTTVTCTATDDAGSTAQCQFLVTVTPPVIFEGFEVYPKGQAIVQTDPTERRLPVQNLGSSGQDGVEISLRRVDALNVSFVPYNYFDETCMAARAQIDLDGMPATLRSELLLGVAMAEAMADFAPLGSTESEVEIRGDNNELLNRYRIPNGSRFDVEALFPPACTGPVSVYSYFQGKDLVWYRFCKPNCRLERVLCIRAIVPEPRPIELGSLQLCFATPGNTTITIEDLKFMEFGNEHHGKPDVLVDGTGPGLRMNINGIGRTGTIQSGGVMVRPPNHDPSALRIDVELVPLSLMSVGPAPGGLMLEAMGTVNGSPSVSLGTASLRQMGGPANALQMTADFGSLGATMVLLDVLRGGTPVGQAMLPMGNLGMLSGDGLIRGCGKLPPRPPCYWIGFDRQMMFTANDGTMLEGDEFRILAGDPTVQVQLLESLCLMMENVDFTILSESIQPAGEVFFPDDVFPPPTATWGRLGEGWSTYGGGAGGGSGGGVVLRRQRLSFFDVFTDLPGPGETRMVEFRAILEADVSTDGGQSFQCMDLPGQVTCRITGAGAGLAGHVKVFDTEMLSMNLRGGPFMIRESPTRPSLGRMRVKELTAGGFFIDSFFDVFTEISMDGAMTWLPGDAGSMLVTMGYDVGPFPTSNLPPPMGSYTMQCPPVGYMTEPSPVIVRNLALVDLSAGPPLDQILIGLSLPVQFQGRCVFEHSRDGGQTWQPEQAECRAVFLISHVFDYEGGNSYFDTEMLQMDLRGGTLPPTVMIRESPTLRSHGRTCLGQNDSNQRLIGSFFDIWTELTLDGGQTFTPATRQARLTLAHGANDCLTIRCPPDIREWTCTEGKIVHYPRPSATSACASVPVIECMPPSGSFFPVGTTTVNCRATDAAGNSAVCSLKIEIIEDSAPPRIVCPTTEIVRWTCSPNGTVVDYPVTASDDCDTDVTIQCHPPAGTVLAPGTHTIVCEAIDDCGKRDQCQFTVVVREDTEPPRINCSSNIVVWTCNPDGTNVGYVVTATDDCDEDVELTCTPPPGHFNPGVTTVTCRAVDACNRESTCTFTVTVRVDQTPPQLNCPTSVVGWTCDPTGMQVEYTVTATDDGDPNPKIECMPPSGSFFPAGTTIVKCRAIDQCEYVSPFCEFPVIVRHDTTRPMVTCPPDITNWVCSADGGPVTYAVTVNDDCDPNPTVTCNPPSGANFPIGATPVNCVAVDACGNKESCRFLVFLVQDTQPPRLNCPEKIDICTCHPNGTNVTYNVSATDDCDTDVIVVCNPPSGSLFPPGTTVVTCTARDDCGNSSECSFPVSVTVNTVAITCPADMTVLTCSDTAVVNYSVTAANRCDTASANRCVAPDNGTGTARLPADCPYLSNEKMTIRDGLPQGSTVEIAPVLHSVVCSPSAPTPPPCPSDCYVQDDCDPRNGETVLYGSTARLELEGTGMFADYRRTLVIPHMLEKSGYAARNPGDPVQSFITEMLGLQGQLPPGDPDFDLLRITAGNEFGLPSPGHTTLTRLSDGNWEVDSFFDITYRIDFVGKPGGALSGMSGSTTGTIRIHNNPGPAAPTVVCNPPSGSSFPIGTTTVTCSARNECGASDTCSFDVTVRGDQEPPRLNCPQRIDICTCNPNGTNATYNVTATDDTDTNPTVVCNPPSGSHFPPGTTTVTCTATDACGKQSECSFRVTVTVNQVAIVCPQDMTVLTCSDTAVVNYSVTAANRCDTASANRCVAPDNGTGTARLPADCPYVSNGKMTIRDGLPEGSTVEIAPVLHSFVCSPTAPTPPPCASDCYAQDDCDPRNGETVLYGSTARLELEGTGMFADYRRTLVIPHMLEKSGYAARHPGDPVQSFITEMLGLQGQLPPGDPDFDLLRITAGTGFGMPSPGHTTLTRLPDGNWEVDSFFDITYRIDFVGKPGGALSGMSGSTTGTIRIANNTGTGAPTVVCNPPSGSSFPIGTTTVMCSARNECGASDTCSFDVTVRGDQEPPRLNCPQQIDICTCHPNGTNVTYNVTATDDTDPNPSVVCNPPSGSHFPPGTTTVTCTATDACGKQSDCTFPVTVTVNTVAIVCPQDMTVLTCSNTAVVNYSVTAANRCDTASANRCVAPDSGTGTARLPADCPRTSAERMRIVDGLPPGTTIEIAPLSHSFICREGAASACGDCFVQDDCDPRNGEELLYENTLHLTLDGTGGLAGYRRTLVLPHVLERCQNGPRDSGDPVQSFITEMLGLQGQLPPGDPDFDLLRITAGTGFGMPSPGHTTLTRLPDGNWEVDSFFDITYRIDFVGKPGGALSGMSGSTTGTIRIHNNPGPAAPTVVCNPPSGSSFPPGATTVTCVASNDCGFADRCEFKVTVIADQEPPRLDCPTNIVVWTCDQEGQRVDYTVSATDDRDTNVTVTCTPPSGSLFPPGNTTVTCVAEDDCGHKTECSFVVRVILDRQPPDIRCPSNIVVETDYDCKPVEYQVEARDDCDTNVVVRCDPPSGTCFPVGTNDVMCVAIDDSGNRSECKFQIVVMKMPPPQLTIRRAASGDGFIICWPAASEGFKLQCARRLHAPSDWEPVTNASVLNGDDWCIPLPNDGPHRFYRLHKPPPPTISGGVD